ncbi:hypothetical protein TSMEX_005304 [Taenia solium]|eukprot:TsM_000465500 transcript=TsM_000465500 gene=TsM_000465500
MFEDHSQESNIKSSFFSRPPQYPLEVNSVYRPKFSNLMTDKPFTKPFYAREDRKSMEKISLGTIGDDSIPLARKCNVGGQKFSSIECSTNPQSLTSSRETKDSDNSEKLEESADRDAGIDMSVDLPPSVNVRGPIENQSILLGANEEPSGVLDQSFTSPIEIDKLNASDMPSLNDSAIPQVPEPNRLCMTNNVTLSLMELPPSIYVPPSYPIPPVMLSNSVTAFPPTPVESIVSPMLTPQVFLQGQQQQQHRKPFSTSKNKGLNSMPPVFQENGMYGAGMSQNGTNKEYYVMVHVEAGATFSIRTGDQEQQIPGPATVRLVLNNGPPLPMPMQVPPGHLVQQIVDEDGVLTHVILSPIAPYSPHKMVSSGPTGDGASTLTRPSPSSASGSFSGSTPRLPIWPSRLRTTGGVNVIISPKTSPGLAVAGPTWPTHTRPGDVPLIQPSPPPLHQLQTQHKSKTDVLPPPNETVTPLLEQRREPKQEKQVGCKRETLEETYQQLSINLSVVQAKSTGSIEGTNSHGDCSFVRIALSPIYALNSFRYQTLRVSNALLCHRLWPRDDSPRTPASTSSTTPSRSKKQSTSGKKKVTTNAGVEGESNKSRAKKSRKAPSVEATAPVSLTTPEEVPKTELNCHRGGQEGQDEAQKGPSQPKVSALLRDDYSSLTFDETDSKALAESASHEPNGAASADTSLSQRTAKPVNVVRPTNGGRPLSAMNGDLTPAEACELKSSFGRLNGRPLDPSSSPTVSPPIQVANRPDNVWAARKLAALGGYAEGPAATTTATTTMTTGKPDRSGEKPNHMPPSTITTMPTKPNAITPGTASGKQGISEKRKKTSKNGRLLMAQKFMHDIHHKPLIDKHFSVFLHESVIVLGFTLKPDS